MTRALAWICTAVAAVLLLVVFSVSAVVVGAAYLLARFLRAFVEG